MSSVKTDSDDKWERELIVVVAPKESVELMKQRIDREIARFGLALDPVFDKRELDGPQAKRLMVERSWYFSVNAPDSALDDIAAALRERSEVAAAYVKAKGAPPRSIAPRAAPAVTNDFTHLQTYFGPGGVNAIAVSGVPGADGTDVRVVDLERNWNFDHEDLQRNRGKVLVGTATGPKHHGTAVLGIIAGDDTNAFGINGIASAALINGAAFTSGTPTATTIDAAAKTLRAGDIMLIEWDRTGPRNKRIPIEWWPDDLLAIQSAVARDIIVVAAAGNGSENLGNTAYDTPGNKFPPEWKNPFGSENDSGAILVGAGAPPPGTHGANLGPDRSRLLDSNYGGRVDVQGWGAEVTTTGYGDLTPIADPNKLYTIGFNYTSSAAAMIAGVIASVQGARKKAAKTLWNSVAARDALRDAANGSQQQNGDAGPATERIGPRPNLARLLALP